MRLRVESAYVNQLYAYAVIFKLRFGSPKSFDDIVEKRIVSVGKQAAEANRLFASCKRFACAVRYVAQFVGDEKDPFRYFGFDILSVVKHAIDGSAGHAGFCRNIFYRNSHVQPFRYRSNAERFLRPVFVAAVFKRIFIAVQLPGGFIV